MQSDVEVIKYEILVEELDTNEALIQLLKTVATEENISFEDLKQSILTEAAKGNLDAVADQVHDKQSVSFINKLKGKMNMKIISDATIKRIKEKLNSRVNNISANTVALGAGVTSSAAVAISTTTVWSALGVTVLFGTASLATIAGAGLIPAIGGYIGWKGLQKLSKV